MITRPLDLASRLRPEPRSFDWLFYVNAGLLVLFFALFGSRFVLAPGVSVLPEIAGSDANARRVTHYITVNDQMQIIAGDGLRDLKSLSDWFKEEVREWRKAPAKASRRPVLLIQSNKGVELDLIAKIHSEAELQGFEVHIASIEPRTKGK
ncbi:MAG: hypothetical protein V4773_09610 [Verrucomicrobiota bacterium]